MVSIAIRRFIDSDLRTNICFSFNTCFRSSHYIGRTRKQDYDAANYGAQARHHLDFSRLAPGGPTLGSALLPPRSGFPALLVSTCPIWLDERGGALRIRVKKLLIADSLFHHPEFSCAPVDRCSTSAR